MDYFLRMDARCYKLISDSTQLSQKIDLYKINEALYKANEVDLKSQISYNKTIANNYKTDLANEKAESGKWKDKAKFRGKVLIGSLSLNLALLGIGFVFIKL